MTRQTTQSSKCLAAVVTAMRPRSRVDTTSVFHHVTALSERLPTDVAHVWSLAGVQAAVVRQITPCSKCLAAVVTVVRPLPGVGTNV